MAALVNRNQACSSGGICAACKKELAFRVNSQNQGGHTSSGGWGDSGDSAKLAGDPWALPSMLDPSKKSLLGESGPSGEGIIFAIAGGSVGSGDFE
jgi:hypothetical protein